MSLLHQESGFHRNYDTEEDRNARRKDDFAELRWIAVLGLSVVCALLLGWLG